MNTGRSGMIDKSKVGPGVVMVDADAGLLADVIGEPRIDSLTARF